MSVDKCSTSDEIENAGDDAEKGNEIKFEPPVFRQRYAAVLAIAKKNKIQSVVDLGCAECKMLIMYKNILNLAQIIGVDIDLDLIERFSYRAKPMMHEFFVKPRSVQLRVQLLAGCVSKKDERLQNIGMVSAIELIEHLHKNVLEAFPQTVFGFIKPRVVVITTPNAEFNKYFDFAPGQMRHPDHKFEWSREQFRQWCDSCCEIYGYNVEFTQIGFLDFQTKEDRDNTTGGCSQMAVFTKVTEVIPSKSHSSSKCVTSDGECYETVFDEFYPYDSRNITTRIVDELHYVLGRLTTEAQLTCDMTGISRKVEIPLDKFLEFPLLRDLVDAESSMLLKVITDGIAHLEFSDIEVIQLDDGTNAITKWVYPYESSLNSADEENDVTSGISHFADSSNTEPGANIDDVVVSF